MANAPSPRSTALPSGAHPGAVDLAVIDGDVMTSFYRDVLGLRVRRSGSEALELGTGTRTLVRLLPGARDRPDAAAPGLYHLALLLPDRAALGTWLKHALTLRAPLQGAADHAVSEAVYLADPEGNGVEVYRDRPRGAWRVERGQVHMGTDPFDAEGVLASAADAWVGAPDDTRVGHVHLQVSELPRSAAFYRDVVGFPITNDRFPGACFLGAAGYHHHLGLNVWAVRPGAVRRGGSAGLAAFELRVPAPGDLDAVALRAEAAGVRASRRGPALELADADGIAVRVTVEDETG